MNAPSSLKSILSRHIVRRSIVMLFALILISGTVTFFLMKYNMTNTVQRTAIALAEAFRTKIVEGDIKTAETQMKNLVEVEGAEAVMVLDKDLSQMYSTQAAAKAAVKKCSESQAICFDKSLTSVQAFVPLFFDQGKTNLFGYLYLSKKVRIDWVFVFITFSIFALGYAASILGILAAVGTSIEVLAKDLGRWAIRLKGNPKDNTSLGAAPFLELAPLKEAIEGLNHQIEHFESQASERTKLLVLRGIAHDLLGPVSQIQLNMATIDTLVNRSRDPRDAVEDLKSSLDELVMVATQVKFLNHEFADEGPSEITSHLVSAVEAVKASREIRERNIELTLSIPKSQILTSLTKVEVFRILFNLVKNAAQASSQGSEIAVRLSRTDKDVKLAVTDQGQGIPQKFLKKVFDADFTSKPGGTGLGLTIVKHICEQRRGKIQISSSAGVGTEAVITIPGESSENIHVEPISEGENHAI